MGKVVTPYDDLTFKIIGLAMAVHRELGPGFPEKICQTAMTVAMAGENVPFENEFPVSVFFRKQLVGKFKLDLVVAQTVILELKSVESLTSIHIQQVIAYLTASGLPVGLLINFGAPSLQYKRLFPPASVQSASAFQKRKS
jgi:GxxExxY protein